MRIVSLDYCADNYVLKLADRDQILAVSPDATKSFTYMRDAARGLPQVRPIAEDVLTLKPDLIVRSYGGGPNAAGFFQQAGIPVLQLGWTNRIDGETDGSIAALIEHAADGLGQADRGAQIIKVFRDRLDAIQADATGRSALYLTAGGVTTGPGSLLHEAIEAAGLANFDDTPGWRALPLEQLVYDQPDLLAAAFFGTSQTALNGWSAANHPITTSLIDELPVVPLDAASTACGAWFILDAVEALAAGATE